MTIVALANHLVTKVREAVGFGCTDIVHEVIVTMVISEVCGKIVQLGETLLEGMEE